MNGPTPAGSTDRACGLAMALVIVLLVQPGCSLITDFSEEKMMEETVARCTDNVDNDGNGKIDCADPSCFWKYDFCKEDSDTRCSDKKDNDLDKNIDCKDEDCCTFASCSLEPTCGESSQLACSDGLDNDQDKLTDCADFSCTGSECCSRMIPIVQETFDSGDATCIIPDCGVRTDCCSQTWLCNPLDGARWISWGQPPPRLSGGKLSPNQPCTSCLASGVVSVASADLAPGLHLEFEGDLQNSEDAVISVGLVDRALIPKSSASCGGVTALFRFLLGMEMTKSTVTAVMSEIVVATTKGKTKGVQRGTIEVDSNGYVDFLLDGRSFYRFKVTIPSRSVRLLIQGRSTSARVDNVVLAQNTGCPTPSKWVAGPFGPGTVLSPSVDDQSFDRTAVSDPCVLFDGQTYRMYYSGYSSTTVKTLVGLATSTDGLTWTKASGPLKLEGETGDVLAEPSVIQETDGTFLMAYRRKVWGQNVEIALATSTDGTSFKRVGAAVALGSAGDWDSSDIYSPALASFKGKLHIWYVGKGTDSMPALGLAVEGSKRYTFSKYKEPTTGAWKVLEPATGQFDDRGVTDPWVLPEGNLLHLWYVGHTLGKAVQVNYAVSQDGVHWVRYPQNPVIKALDSALFGEGIQGPTVIQRWGTLHLWYNGKTLTGHTSIGYLVNQSS